jgi:signal transduction histidine kinase
VTPLPQTPSHGWASALAFLPAGLDAVLATAYYSIALALLYYYTRRPHPVVNGKLAVFVGYGLVCGTVYTLGVLKTWQLLPGAQAALKPVAAALAALTALLLARLVPRLLALPAPEALQEANAHLRGEVARRTAVEDELRRLQARLESAVQQRTRELERVRDALQREVAERRRVDREKDHLMATVSHELRTPLTSISGALHVLAGALELTEAERAELAEIALRSTGRLIRLVNGLQEIDGIQGGRLRMHMRPLSLAELAAAAVQELTPFAREHGVCLRLTAAPHSTPARGDADRLMQVLTNLISNAVRHAPRGSEVVVRTEAEGPTARVTVTDRGPGVPPDYRERIFERFVQIPHRTAVPAGGVGLGLSIGRAIVERHGGRIGVESQPGRATAFFFELPLLPDPEPEPEPAPPRREHPRVHATGD